MLGRKARKIQVLETDVRVLQAQLDEATERNQKYVAWYERLAMASAETTKWLDSQQARAEVAEKRYFDLCSLLVQKQFPAKKT